MFENDYDEAIDEVSIGHGLNWNDDSKVRLFARFLDKRKIKLADWKRFLEAQAVEETLE